MTENPTALPVEAASVTDRGLSEKRPLNVLSASRSETLSGVGSGGRKLAFIFRNSFASNAIAVIPWAIPLGNPRG